MKDVAKVEAQIGRRWEIDPVAGDAGNLHVEDFADIEIAEGLADDFSPRNDDALL